VKIAVSGKGGVGKTTLSAGLIQSYADSGEPVYGIDADPDTSLGITLGINEDKLDELIPLIDMKEVIEEKNKGGGVLVDLNPEIENVLTEYSLQLGNIKFLKMGGVKQGGSACYCKENSFLQSLLNSLLLDKVEPVIIDMSAGIEHLTRGTARGVDTILVVTEPTATSVKTAGVVKKLAYDLGIEKIFIAGNKVRNKEDRDFISDAFSEDEIIGMISFEEELLSNAQKTGTVNKYSNITGINDIWKKLLGGEK